MDYTKDYVQILKESLERKLKLLDKIADYISEQKNICKSQEFDIDEFDRLVEAKSDVAEEIEDIDKGFTLVYDRVGELIKKDKDSYKEDIALMQQYISLITEKVAGIQADEKRIFEAAKEKLVKKRQEIGAARKSNQMAANYYKSMSKTSDEPQFMDKKN